MTRRLTHRCRPLTAAGALMPDLEELYREIILDHYRSPRNRGELPSPPAHRVEGFNPLCGDEVVVTLEVEDGALADIKIGGTGCSISQSSASLMSGAVKGKPLDEVQPPHPHLQVDDVHPRGLAGRRRRGDGDGVAPTGRTATRGGGGRGRARGRGPRGLGELAALQGVVKFPVRIKCATLSWNTLAQGLRRARADG